MDSQKNIWLCELRGNNDRMLHEPSVESLPTPNSTYPAKAKVSAIALESYLLLEVHLVTMKHTFKIERRAQAKVIVIALESYLLERFVWGSPCPMTMMTHSNREESVCTLNIKYVLHAIFNKHVVLDCPHLIRAHEPICRFLSDMHCSRKTALQKSIDHACLNLKLTQAGV